MPEPKTNYELTKEKIIQLRLKVIFEVLMIVLGLIFVFMSINGFFTIMPMDQFIPMMIVVFAVLAVLAGITLFTHFKIKNVQLKYLIYVILAIVFTLVGGVLLGVRIVTSLMIMSGVFVTIPFLTFQKKYLILYGLLIIGMGAFVFISTPVVEVSLGAGYLLNIIMAVVIGYYGLFRTMGLFNWFDSQLAEEIKNTREKNIELCALNEEYLASEEELFAQYEEIKKQDEQIKKLAYYDSLTNLPNRIGFCNHIEEHYSGIENARIMLIDIDNFKYFNDTFGYTAGDALITMVSEGLKELGETLVIGRVGSDDFGILLDRSVEPVSVIEHIKREISTFVFEETEFGLTYSIGIARMKTGEDIVDSLKNAELAMYKVKERGKNGYDYFDVDYSKEVHTRLMMTNALEKAIDNDEIHMVYQPVVEVSTQKIVSAEALVRWTSPTFGKVPADTFIQLSEQTGYIYTLGLYIIRQVCSFIKSSDEKRCGRYISINISGKQLLNPEFVKDFKAIVRETDVNPTCIGIEITETAVIEHFEQAITALLDLKSVGIRIYLDDFGTGYSSLNYLSRMPIDILKIDKSFIDTVHINDRDRKMVRNIIQMGKSLDLEVVAEGVELEEQFEILRALECDRIQGYYFHKPMTGEQLSELALS